jgi:hypothetical protein
MAPQPQTTYVLRIGDSAVPLASWERIVRDVDPLAHLPAHLKVCPTDGLPHVR